MKTILHTVDIQAAPAALYQALTTEAGLTGWWSKRVSADVRVGGVIHFKFGQRFNPDMEILTLEEPRLVEWRCVGGHDYWKDNTFRFELVARSMGSVLLFRQEYARELNDEEYGRYNYNWGYYLESLRLLLETGEGKPYLSTA